ncbi:MAG TPA: hypothetical protein VG602_08120 [Actinomycetota bacterium]|nr:hypothetical protein [Actinomycetota bacterium]
MPASLRPLGLAVLALVVVVMAAAGALPRWPGLVHAVAIPPLDLGFDLRLLAARAHTWQAFAVGALVSVAARSALLAFLLGPGRAGAGFWARYRSAIRLYLGAVVPLAAGALLEFAGLAAVYAWYAWVGLGLSLAAVVIGTRRLSRVAGGTRSARLHGLFLYLAGLVVLGALARTGPWAAVVLVALSAALTWWTLHGSAALRRRRHAALALTLVLVPGTSPGPAVLVGQQRPQQRPVLFLVPGVDTSSGYGSLYGLDPRGIGFPCDRVYYYSYRGPRPPAPRAPKDRTAQQGEAVCPIRLHEPYVREDTQRPLAELTATLAGQLAAIAQTTGGAPVVIVTHSQGAAIAWQVIATGQATGISHVIALAGFGHTPVAYPPPGLAGEGRVGADVLRVLSWISRTLGIGTFDPDAPLARELLARADGLESVFAQPLPPGTRAVTLLTTFDVVAAPEGQEVPGVPAGIIDTTHTGVIDSPEAGIAARSVLAGGEDLDRSPAAFVLQWILPAWLPPAADPP